MTAPKPTPTDGFITQTTHDQLKTETALLDHLPAPGADKPPLERQKHFQFLVRNLFQGFPARFIGQDASQPWLVYWTVHSCYLLGAALDPQNKQRVIDTVLSYQHPDGGFGGGPGQFPHLLPTYAAVCALAIVGRPGPGGGWDQIDRQKIYDFFMSLKQPDGSFLVSRDSEVDIRGTYCLLVVATLLNLLTPELLAGTPEFVASLQTYEGGFASASQPYYASSPESLESLLDNPRPPLGEAHGGYAFCALASWVMLEPLIRFLPSASTTNAASRLNVKNLVRWLTQMQGGQSDLGGFRGRTNKLVDACYAWWVAGAIPLLRTFGVGTSHRDADQEVDPSASASVGKDKEQEDDHDAWDDVDDSIFDRLALQGFILYAAQHPAGGLRDKPPKIADSYHTVSALAGLSTAQHCVLQKQATRDKLKDGWKPDPENGDLDELRKTAFCEARCWTEEEGLSRYVNTKEDRINATHPIFNLTMTHVKDVMTHFYKQ